MCWHSVLRLRSRETDALLSRDGLCTGLQRNNYMGGRCRPQSGVAALNPIESDVAFPPFPSKLVRVHHRQRPRQNSPESLSPSSQYCRRMPAHIEECIRRDISKENVTIRSEFEEQTKSNQLRCCFHVHIDVRFPSIPGYQII